MVRIKFGDVIYVDRNCGIFGYKHFGIYSGNKNVIHYTKGSNNEFDGIIRETPFERFLGNDSSCHVCHFDDEGNRNSTEKTFLPQSFGIQSAAPNLTALLAVTVAKGLYDSIFAEKGKLYSAQETVERARSCIGKRGYNLLLHNCEHFAIWCKTGVEKSEQVEDIIKLVAMTAIKI